MPVNMCTYILTSPTVYNVFTVCQLHLSNSISYHSSFTIWAYLCLTCKKSQVRSQKGGTMVSLVDHNRARAWNSLFQQQLILKEVTPTSRNPPKTPLNVLSITFSVAVHQHSTPSPTGLMASIHTNTKNTGFRLDSALCKQGAMESRHLWLTRQLWNHFQNVLISWQEWAMASQKMQSSEPLPDYQTQVKPNFLQWGWAITLLFWLLQSRRCLPFHSSKLNEWWIKVSQTRVYQGRAAGDRFLI